MSKVIELFEFSQYLLHFISKFDKDEERRIFPLTLLLLFRAVS